MIEFYPRDILFEHLRFNPCNSPLTVNSNRLKMFLKYVSIRTSLVAQWIRVACQRRGHGFDPWSGKIPHAMELTPCTTSTEARRSRAHAPQQEKPPQGEARAPQRRVAPARHN